MTNISNIIFTSDQLARQHKRYYEKIQAEPGIRWGIPSIDRSILPLRGGDVCIVAGRPGDGKTSILCRHAAYQAQQIVAAKKGDEETVVFVTWEGTVDKIYAAIMASRGQYSSTDYYWGRVPKATVGLAAITMGIMPITFIGFSTMREAKYKAITLPMILEAVEEIHKGASVPKRKVVALYMDYAQLIPVPGADGRTESTSEAIIGVKSLGMRLDLPTMIAAQAGRQVDTFQVKVAGPADLQHSSQLEQHVDFGFSLWRPARTETIDPTREQEINVWGQRLRLTQPLIIVKNWKQRGDASGFWWPLHFRPELLRLAEIEGDMEEM